MNFNLWATYIVVFLITTVQLAIGSFEPCIHGGIRYKDGDYFPPNKTFIKTDGPMQCVHCRCRQGLVVCEIENCTTLDCDNPVRQTRFCCLQCPGNFDGPDRIPGNAKSTEQEQTDLIVGQKKTSDNLATGKLHKNDCISNGRNYANGSVWQPIIGPFGAMACVQCQCREGSVVCSRLRCSDQTCSNPKRELGKCCPTCPPPVSDPGTIAAAFLTSCLPRSSEFFVYTTANLENNTDEIVFAFLENTSDRRDIVTLFIWNMRRTKDTSDVLVVKTSTATELAKLDLQLQGSVSQKRFKKFSQRGERLRSKCYVQCLKKIKRLENSLGVVPVVSKMKCDDDEIDIKSI